MKASEVLIRYAAGERDFHGVNLRGQSFKGKNLKQADFSEADLRSTNFTAANLKEANLTGAKCGLQGSGVILLTIISWLIASISGFLSILSVNLISRISDSSSQDTQVAGWISLIILIVSLILTFYCGARAGATAVALPAIGTIALAVVAGVLGGVISELAEVLLKTVAVAAVGAFSVTQAIATGIVVALAVAVGGIVGGTVGGTIAAALTILVSVFTSASVTRAAEIAIILTTVVSTVFVCVGWRAWKGNQKDAWVRSLAIAFAAMGGTSFRDANLTEANFTEAKLKSADFRKAILTRTLWRDAQRIDFARPGETYLNSASLRHLLITGVGQGQNFDRQDLRGVNLNKANLENASFIDTDFYQANLRGANLSRTILVRANFERADLRNANLTGSCIQDWVITERTKLDGIICDYVYLKWINGDKRDQMPPRGKFKEGGFVTFVRYILETVELYHEKDINPRLALTVLQKMSRDYDEPFDIVALGKKGERVFVQVKVSEHIARENFKDDYYSRYDTGLKLWSGNIHQLPPTVDSFIEKKISEIASEKTDDFVFVNAAYVEGNYIENVEGNYLINRPRRSEHD